MSSLKVFLAILMIAIFSSLSAQAQRADSLAANSRASLIDLDEGVAFEIAPHTGLMGKSGTFGLRLSMNYSSLNLELSGEQVIGKLANLYPLSVSAILNLSTHSRLIPYGGAGIGLLLTVPTATVGDESVSSMAVNFKTADYKLEAFSSNNFGFILTYLLCGVAKSDPDLQFLQDSAIESMYFRCFSDLDCSADIIQASVKVSI